MAPITTRAASKSKLENSSDFRKKDLNSSLKNSPTGGTTLVSKCGLNTNTSTGIFTAQDIITDLRKKLVTTQQALADLEIQHKQLQIDLKRSTDLNTLYTEQLSEHVKMIDALTLKHNRPLVSREIQTEEFMEVKEPLSQNILKPTLVSTITQTEELAEHTQIIDISAPKTDNNTAINETKQTGELGTVLSSGLRVQTSHINKVENPASAANVSKHHRILLVSDSHGRNLRQGVQNNLISKNVSKNDITIESIFKPNATFAQTCNNIQYLTKNFNKYDNVFITAGTNDTNMQNFKKSVYNLLSSCQSVNLHINTIPYRYDRPELNDFIYEKNKFLFDLSLIYKFKLIDVNLFLNRGDYTKHGLHFNRGGKDKLCYIFVEFLKNNKDFFQIFRN